MINFYLNAIQSQVGLVAGMWTQEDLAKARKSEDGHIKDNWYLQVKAIVNGKPS